MTDSAKRIPRTVRPQKRRTIHSQREHFKNQLGEILSYVEQLEFPFEPVDRAELEPVEVTGTVLGDGSSFRKHLDSNAIG